MLEKMLEKVLDILSNISYTWYFKYEGFAFKQVLFREHFFNTMLTSSLKYRLQELVNDLPRGVNIGTLQQMLADHYGISALSFLRHRNLPADSASDMSARTLAAYADFFDVTMEELLTPPEQKTKRPSVYELLNTQKRAKVADVVTLANMSAGK